MSVYSVKGKGWRYDFVLNGNRYTSNWVATKLEARQAEARKRDELVDSPAAPSAPAKPPEPAPPAGPTAPPAPPAPAAVVPPAGAEMPTDMAFLDLVNRRLDYLKAYKTNKYYVDQIYAGRRFVKEWGEFDCREITLQMIQAFLIKRSSVSAYSANKDLRYIRALFNFGIKQGLVQRNPTQGLEFMPQERRLKYVPPKEDVAKVLLAAPPDVQDYLVAIKETMGRMGEINRLVWDDVDFDRKTVVLYTRKKRGGHLTPRKVPMTTRLCKMLQRRYESRDESKPWVFWVRHWSHKAGSYVEAPYQHRKNLMAVLCQQAGVRRFGFHALRHFGASVLERASVPIGSIQRLLGHESRTTTEIYLHSIGEAEREAMEIFERACQDPELDRVLEASPTQVPHKVPHRQKGGRGQKA